MPGFWSGFAQGWEAEQDRIAKRKLFQQEILEKRRDALVPLVAKRQQAEAEYKKAQNQVRSFFAARLKDSDIPPEQQEAFLNIAASDPERGLNLMEYVQRFENKHETRLAGGDLIKATRIFEDTKPEDMEMDEWISVAANVSAVDDEGGFNAGATIDRIMSASTTDELREISASLTVAVGGETVGESTPLGVDPSFQTADMAEREAARGGGGSGSDGPSRTDESSAFDSYNDALTVSALAIQEQELKRVNSTLEDEKLKAEMASEGKDAANDPESATYKYNQALQQREEMIASRNRLDTLAPGSGDGVRLAAIPEWIRKKAYDDMYERDEVFSAFVDAEVSNPALTGTRRSLFNVWAGISTPTTAPEPTVVTPNPTAQPGATVPEVPDFTVDVPENDYAPDPYNPQEEEEDSGNPFMDKYN